VQTDLQTPENSMMPVAIRLFDANFVVDKATEA